MALSALRKGSRILSLWPSLDLRAPPKAPPLEPQSGRQDGGLTLRGLTANDLIAMARAARARRAES